MQADTFNVGWLGENTWIQSAYLDQVKNWILSLYSSNDKSINLLLLYVITGHHSPGLNQWVSGSSQCIILTPIYLYKWLISNYVGSY